MTHHHKKKNASHSKYELRDGVYFSKLKVSLENLYGEAIDAFKKLASNKRMFSYYEAKILEVEKKLESLKQTV